MNKTLTRREEIKSTTLHVKDYWQWAYSNIICNTERAVFALNGIEEIRTNWTEYDILTPEGIKIEVKASGYLQAWEQEKLSTIKFDIHQRCADVYVFCLHNHQDKANVNILDIGAVVFFSHSNFNA